MEKTMKTSSRGDFFAGKGFFAVGFILLMVFSLAFGSVLAEEKTETIDFREVITPSKELIIPTEISDVTKPFEMENQEYLEALIQIEAIGGIEFAHSDKIAMAQAMIDYKLPVQEDTWKAFESAANDEQKAKAAQQLVNTYYGFTSVNGQMPLVSDIIDKELELDGYWPIALSAWVSQVEIVANPEKETYPHSVMPEKEDLSEEDVMIYVYDILTQYYGETPDALKEMRFDRRFLYNPIMELKEWNIRVDTPEKESAYFFVVANDKEVTFSFIQ
ncbi:MAG: hypothetical protein GX786_05540 [Clostridiales bacterium]|nr:hypothetical protein [Clostridiales bacterium]